MKQQLLFIGLSMAMIISCKGQVRYDPSSIKPFKDLEEIKTYLKEQESKKLFSGTVLITRGDDIIFREAYGLSNIEKATPNTPETKINIGSINKAFTGTAIMQLVEQGKISLDDKIANYIPELKADMADKITIRQLLQMKSGLGSYFESEKFLSMRKTLKNVEDYLPILTELELGFEPGTDQQYSNAGYELLGILIQRVSKQNYYKYIEQNIYRKAGMKNTGSFERDKPVKNLAQGYSMYATNEMFTLDDSPDEDKKYIYNINDRLAIKGSAAGGGFSTIDDLMRFAKALRTNTLLTEASTQLVINRFNEPLEGKGAIRIAGGAPGINSALISDFEKNYTVVVLSNYDPPTATELAGRLVKTLEVLNL